VVGLFSPSAAALVQLDPIAFDITPTLGLPLPVPPDADCGTDPTSADLY